MKKITQSKTIAFNILMALIPVLEATFPMAAQVFGGYTMVVYVALIIAGNVTLRLITKDALTL